MNPRFPISTWWRTTGPALVLGVALVASCLLGYQAVVSQRSHRNSVERTLANLAAVAAWETRRIVGERLQQAVHTTLWPASRMGTAERPFPPPTILSEVELQEVDCACPMPLAAQFYFRLDLVRNEIATDGEIPPDGFRTALASAIGERIGLRIEPAWHGILLEVPRGEDHYTVAVTVLPDSSGGPAVAYGAVIHPSTVGPIMRQALEAAVLLPPSVGQGVPYDSLFVVSAFASRGTPVFRSGDSEWSTHMAAESLGPFLGDLRLEVGLRADRLDQLALIPNSRTYVLVSFLLGAIGLFAMAFVQLRRQQELLQTRNRFIAGVSHELRTPLAQIRMFSQTLRLGRERSAAERGRFLQFLDEAAQRLSNLVEDILRFERIQHGQDTLVPRPTSVAALLHGVTEAFEPLAATRDVTLSIEIEPDLVTRVDPDATHRVLLNLMDNAVKYGPRGQTVRIGAAGAVRSVRIWVRDQGVGVPTDAQTRIFEPFIRLSREVESAVGGTGLGLAVVRDLVERQNGRVWVENGSDGGARFIIEMPRERDAASREEAQHLVGSRDRATRQTPS